jgi:hypothetical protein
LNCTAARLGSRAALLSAVLMALTPTGLARETIAGRMCQRRTGARRVRLKSAASTARSLSPEFPLDEKSLCFSGKTVFILRDVT